MPYIKNGTRAMFAHDLENLAPTIWEPGELNYVISYLCDAFLGKDMGYETANEVIGVLECAKLEIYRRVIAPYEDAKMLENGDVFGYNEETKPPSEGA